MAKFIKLHLEVSEHDAVYINVDKITAILSNWNRPKNDKCKSMVYLNDGHEPCKVVESNEEIMTMINSGYWKFEEK